jgi:hypothetical protein
VEITVGKILSGIVAMIYTVIFIVAEGGPTTDIVKLWLVLAIPLTLIWFPDELGSITGSIGRGGYITRETPGCFLSIAGWVLLVSPPLVPLVAYMLQQLK